MANLEDMLRPSRLPGKPTPEEIRARREGVIPARQRIGGLLEALSMAPSPAEIPLSMAGAALKASSGENSSMKGILGAAALAGMTESLPFDEILGPMSKISKGNAKRLINKLERSTGDLAFDEVGARILQNLGDEGIEKLSKNIKTPDEAIEFFRSLGFPQRQLELAEMDIKGNYNQLIEMSKRKGFKEMMEKSDKYKGINIEDLPMVTMQEKIIETLKGFRDNSKDSLGAF